ncbi:MAG: hypothetical protein A6F71_09685 [Cycloclasticus sp. symbiont of Poecilosclerida sp. M]|nr:MAG: hypothetical protein A6F71_09685 [Cycloclasticus sp. symbiont of Poecilosclerida sp. M]
MHLIMSEAFNFAIVSSRVVLDGKLNFLALISFNFPELSIAVPEVSIGQYFLYTSQYFLQDKCRKVYWEMLPY